MLQAYINAQHLLEEAQEYLLTPKKGQGLVEYGLIIVLIAVFLIGALALVGTRLDDLFRGITFSRPAT